MKTLLKKANGDKAKFKESVSEWANCPSARGQSVNQLFYRRILRSPKIPSLRQKIDSSADMKDRLARQIEEKAKRVRRQPSPLLEEGEKVWLQDSRGRWAVPGTVQHRRSNNRSYVIQANNALYLRNARFVRPRLEPEEDQHLRPDLGTAAAALTADTAPQAAALPVAAEPVYTGPVTRARSRRQAAVG